MIQRMFGELERVDDQNITFIAYTLATYSLQRSNVRELPWLERTYKHVYDIITESPFYKSIIAKGLEQGRQQGLEQGLEEGIEKGIEKGIERGIEKGIEKGQITALRQAIVDVVHERLPALVPLAESQVATINDPTRLRRLIVRLITVPDAEQATQAFLDAQQSQ